MLIAISILVTRSSRMADIVRAQGPWPHSWLIFHDPAFTAVSLLAMSALIPVADGAMPTEKAAGVAGATALRKPAHLPAVMLLTFLTNRVHLWLQSILLVVLLFGGWAVPFDTGYISQARGLWLFVPTIVLLIKAWSMSSALSFARTLFCSITFRHSTPWALKFGALLSLLFGLLVLLWVSGLRHWSLQWADAAMRWAMLSLVVVLLLTFGLQTRGRIGTRFRTPLENYWM
jgi:NADH:ubiquinone oxidoreductase subunit H